MRVLTILDNNHEICKCLESSNGDFNKYFDVVISHFRPTLGYLKFMKDVGKL